jgi:hypothetical protein
MNFSDLVRMISEGKDPDEKKPFPPKKSDKKVPSKEPTEKVAGPVKDDGKGDGADEVPAVADKGSDKPVMGKDGKPKKPMFGGKNDKPKMGEKSMFGDEPKIGDETDPGADDVGDDEEKEIKPEDGDDEDPEAPVTGNSSSKVDLKPKLKNQEMSPTMKNEDLMDRVTTLLDRIKSKRQELAESKTKDAFVSTAHHAQRYHFHDRSIRQLEKVSANVTIPHEKQKMKVQMAHHDARCNHHASMLERPIKSK